MCQPKSRLYFVQISNYELYSLSRDVYKRQIMDCEDLFIFHHIITLVGALLIILHNTFVYKLLQFHKVLGCYTFFNGIIWFGVNGS